jgi:hypothetical protein
MAPRGRGKRPIDTIDLTNNDNPPFESQSRKAPKPLDSQRFSQSQRNTWVNHDDEEDADDVIILSQDGDNSAMEHYELYGNQTQAAIWNRMRMLIPCHRRAAYQDCWRTIL